MYEEKNTGTNLPAQLDLYATRGDEYKFLFVTKGGGSANKTFLFQEDQGASESRIDQEVLLREDQARSAPRPARRTTWRS